MARRGQKKHLKRLPAPRHWPIKRKEAKFTTRVIPGPHPKEHCLTLAIILREMLGYADTMREVKAILAQGQVKVDGVVRKDPRFPVGLMDVLSITTSGETFRLVPKTRGGFRLVKIDDKEAGYKLCRIETKNMVKGGKVQIGLHDGRSLLLPEGERASQYKTLDTLKITIPEQKLIESFSLENGVYAVISRGKNVGIKGKVLEIIKRVGTHASTVTLEDPEGNRFQTALEYVFVVGKGKPEISLAVEGGDAS
ncbi:MAG: 30S ribosomal protein S4e [Candidatus Thorarchaeota archaeon]|nr:MAG: 30S ribosomal protein S4e [Candidatus Thorarchaeota archaeon]RLI58624.1 MAG: 30S ribosomal protein S4e [Candidatus Thorarchaeota archaeon]